MKKIGLIALGLSLSACAGAPRPAAPLVSSFCSKDASRERGFSDAADGTTRDTAFLRLCAAPERDAFLRAYREGYDAGRRNAHEVARPELKDPPALNLSRNLASPDWVCEVEASAKIFTGVGSTRADADRSARETCGAHFQASYCTQTDCRQQPL